MGAGRSRQWLDATGGVRVGEVARRSPPLPRHSTPGRNPTALALHPRVAYWHRRTPVPPVSSARVGALTPRPTMPRTLVRRDTLTSRVSRGLPRSCYYAHEVRTSRAECRGFESRLPPQLSIHARGDTITETAGSRRCLLLRSTAHAARHANARPSPAPWLPQITFFCERGAQAVRPGAHRGAAS